jgi:hypothetical protein
MPSSKPSETPGLSRAAFPGPHIAAIDAAFACQRGRSRPIAAAGTSPNGESAE